jgi:hypothetical protein
MEQATFKYVSVELQCTRFNSAQFIDKLFLELINMKINKTALAILTLSMFAASSAMAAGDSSEISLNGSFDSGKADYTGAKSYTNTQVIGTYGYYFMPQLVGRLVLGINDSDNGTTKSTMEMYGVGAKYYIGAPSKGAVVPFVFADILALNMQSAGTTMTGSVMDAGAGIAMFLTESVSFDVDAKYRQQSYTASSLTINDTGATVDFGITARF